MPYRRAQWRGGAAGPAAAPGWCPAAPAPARGGPPAARPAGPARHQASKITMMSGSPSCQCPAAMIRSMTPRTWAAVTAARSSSGPSRTASSSRVHDVRPGSSAATSEYGQPGMICALLFPARSSGRTTGPGWSPRPAAASCSHRPPAGSGHHPAGSGTLASAQRSREACTFPQFSASYKAPWPR